MKNEIKRLYSQLKKAGFEKEAQNALNIIKMATVPDKEEMGAVRDLDNLSSGRKPRARIYPDEDMRYNFPETTRVDPFLHGDSEPAFNEGTMKSQELGINERADFLDSEFQRMRSGLKNMVVKALNPKMGSEGHYVVDAQRYISFLESNGFISFDREHGVSAVLPGFMKGEVQVDTDALAEEIYLKYSKFAEAKKRAIFNSLLKKGFIG